MTLSTFRSTGFDGAITGSKAGSESLLSKNGCLRTCRRARAVFKVIPCRCLIGGLTSALGDSGCGKGGVDERRNGGRSSRRFECSDCSCTLGSGRDGKSNAPGGINVWNKSVFFGARDDSRRGFIVVFSAADISGAIFSALLLVSRSLSDGIGKWFEVLTAGDGERVRAVASLGAGIP